MVVPVGTGGRGRRSKGVRKTRKPPPPVMLLPAHPASTVSDYSYMIMYYYVLVTIFVIQLRLVTLVHIFKKIYKRPRSFHKSRNV